MSSTIFSIDPGNTLSAYVILRRQDRQLLAFGKIPNQELRELVNSRHRGGYLHDYCIEYPFPRGQMASWQLIDTVAGIGRIEQMLDDHHLPPPTRVDRLVVKYHLCQSSTAKDSNIHQALIDLYGGEEIALAKPKCPACTGRGATGLGKKRGPCSTCNGTGQIPAGPLFGVSADAWSALAIAITFLEDGHLRRQKDKENQEAKTKINIEKP